MVQQRFRRADKQSFFSHRVYDRIVPKDHFLVRLARLISWQRFVSRILHPYNPVFILKWRIRLITRSATRWRRYIE